VFRTLFRTDDIAIEGAAAELTCFLPFQIFFSANPAGSSDNPGPVGNDSADNGSNSLRYNEAVTVKQGNDRVGGFFDTDDVVRIDVHHLFVHAGQQYHGFTKNAEISL